MFGIADHSWVDKALCASSSPDMNFVQGSAQRDIRNRCFRCEVRLQCLAESLDTQTNFGVWGGLTERERRALLRFLPSIEDWGEWLKTSTDPLAEELRQPRDPHLMSWVRKAKKQSS